MSQDIIETRAGQWMPSVCQGLPTKLSRYPGALPAKLQPWHAYVLDAGHCIFAILLQHEREAFGCGCTGDYLVPVPVKSVMRGFEIKDGYVLAVAGELEYDKVFGLMVPDEDSEY